MLGTFREPTRLLKGGAVLDAPEHVPAVWGNGSEVLWARGEPLILAGPPGVGKTTLAQQLALATITGDLNVLGFGVLPPAGRILYVAADRPQQALRSMRRMVEPRHRPLLDEYLLVSPGPFDALGDPEGLVAYLQAEGVGMVIFDSIKDVAGDVTDSKVGSEFNRVLQAIVAEGIEVLALHHPRKAQADNRKPKRLDDIYGSMALAAGVGSVVYLWGEAGDPIVELLHLKQPASEVGPLTIAHDHDTGVSMVLEAVTARSLLEGSGDRGLTVKAAGKAMFDVEKPNRNQVEKARRQLDALVRETIAEKVESDEPKGQAVYRLRDSRDRSRDQSRTDHGASRNGLSKHHAAITPITRKGQTDHHPLKGGGRDRNRDADADLFEAMREGFDAAEVDADDNPIEVRR